MNEGERQMTKDNNMMGKFQLDGIAAAPRGTPQIEVSFDIDANGIMNVAASDKSTGKSNQITITNDKGRLSQEDIAKMVEEAERFKTEDEVIRKKIDAKNGLETYVYSLKNTLQDDKISSRIDADEENILTQKIDGAITWIENNQNANVEEYEQMQKDVENVAMPIMTKVYQVSGDTEHTTEVPNDTHDGLD